MSDSEYKTPVGTDFIKDFLYSAASYSADKNIYVFSIKVDAENPSTQYLLVNLSEMEDIYTAADGSIFIGGYSAKVKLSSDDNNALVLKNDGLFVNDVLNQPITTKVSLNGGIESKATYSNFDNSTISETRSSINAGHATISANFPSVSAPGASVDAVDSNFVLNGSKFGLLGSNFILNGSTASVNGVTLEGNPIFTGTPIFQNGASGINAGGGFSYAVETVEGQYTYDRETAKLIWDTLSYVTLSNDDATIVFSKHSGKWDYDEHHYVDRNSGMFATLKTETGDTMRYALPDPVIATRTRAGLVKIGSGLVVHPSGEVSLRPASEYNIGGIRVGKGLEMDGLTLNCTAVAGGCSIGYDTVSPVLVYDYAAGSIVSAVRHDILVAGDAASLLVYHGQGKKESVQSNGIFLYYKDNEGEVQKQWFDLSRVPASTMRLGSVMIGRGLEADYSGKVSLKAACDTEIGGVKVDGNSGLVMDGDTLKCTLSGGGAGSIGNVASDSEIDAVLNANFATAPAASLYVAPYNLTTASETQKGGVRVYGNGLAMQGDIIKCTLTGNDDNDFQYNVTLSGGFTATSVKSNLANATLTVSAASIISSSTTTLQGSYIVNGTPTASGLYVSGYGNIGNALGVNGSLRVNGNAFVGGQTTLYGGIKTNAYSTVTNDFQSTNVNVSNCTIYASNTKVYGGAGGAYGNYFLGCYETVGGDLSVGGGATVTGDLKVGRISGNPTTILYRGNASSPLSGSWSLEDSDSPSYLRFSGSYGTKSVSFKVAIYDFA